MPQANAAEFEEFLMWKAQRERQHQRQDGPDPSHRGVIDPNYVRPTPTEFPKMMYRASAKAKNGYATRIVESAIEQESLIKQGWMAKVNDVHNLLNGLARAASGEQEDKAETAKA